jgi:hypothetical protein
VQAAAAGAIGNLECRRDLAIADQLIHAVRLHETAFSRVISSVCAGCCGRICKIWKAREPMAHCMTGHERDENVGRMDTSIGDISFILSMHSVGR